MTTPAGRGREGGRDRETRKSQTPQPPKPRQPQHVGEKKFFRVLHTSAHLGRSPTYSSVRPAVGLSRQHIINFQKA